MSSAEPAANPFAARDAGYLRDVQYATTANLDARVALHRRFSTATTEWFTWLADQVVWWQHRRVLEVGCGTGLLWAKVGDRAAHIDITVSDQSATMVETALGTVSALAQTARGVVAGVSDLPFDDGTFDLVIANHMLYHAPDVSAAVGELARVCAPTGELLAATNGPRHLVELFELEASIFGPDSLRNLNAEAFGALTGHELLGAWFAEVNWSEHADGLVVTSVDDVVAYLTSLPPGSEATDTQRDALAGAVRRRMAQEGGRFVVTKESGAFLARRPQRR